MNIIVTSSAVVIIALHSICAT